MSMDLIPDHDRIIRIETKLDNICKAIKQVTVVLESQGDNYDSLKDLINSKTILQQTACSERADKCNKEFGNRPTWGMVTWIVGILVAVVIGSYGYTTKINDKMNDVGNRMSVVEEKIKH